MRLATNFARKLEKNHLSKQLTCAKLKVFSQVQRALLIEEANETIADIIIKAFDVWKDGDATLIVTAGSLKPTSNLRKFFEQQQNTFSAPIYDNPMTRAEIENMISKAGLKNITQDSFKSSFSNCIAARAGRLQAND